MAGIFRRYMSQTLQQKLDMFLDESHEEQLSLYEELAMMRVIATDNVKLYDAAVGTGKPEIIQLAAETLREGLNSIATMVKHCSDLESKATDKVSARQLNLFVLQICKAVSRIVKDENLAREIINEINDSVRFPTEGVGTTLTPDQQASSMDDTVPSA